MKKSRSRSPNQLRIIGGKFRSRKLPFADIEGLRPTGDRIRETLFNWLSTEIEGARCLDLFAGSGALGFEALSRNAAHVTFVDQAALATELIQQNIGLLKIQHADVQCANSLNWLGTQDEPYNIVFIDPPFASNLAEKACFALEQSGCLAPASTIYLELPSDKTSIETPENWRLLKDKKSGAVSYQLYHRD